MPFWEIRLEGSPAMFSPLNRIRPSVGRRTPVRQLKKVLLPAPFGPMMARISPRRISKSTLSSAVSPPKRTVRPSVRRTGATAPSRTASAGKATATDVSACTLGELAGWREDRLLLWNCLEDPGLAILHVEDELADEGLVILLAQHLVALREVVPFFHFESLERLDQLHRVFAAAELRFLHA